MISKLAAYTFCKDNDATKGPVNLILADAAAFSEKDMDADAAAFFEKDMTVEAAAFSEKDVESAISILGYFLFNMII